MKVIMLKGPGKCGKTTILNVVYDELVNNRGAAVRVAKTGLGANPKDFEAVLDYNGKKIAIFTMGDYSIGVTNAMSKYAPQVDVLIIACNDRFKKPFSAIENYPHVIMPKNKQPKPNDQAVADEIIDEI